MDVRLLSQVLSLRAALGRRGQWDPARIAAYQERSLQRLREATYAGSEFYRRRHSGLHTAPLHELPPVTKADLMDNFDEAITTPDLTLADLEEHLRALTETAGDPGRPFRGRVVGCRDRRNHRPARRLCLEPCGVGIRPGLLLAGQ